MGYLLDLMSGQPTGLFTFLAVFTFLVGKLVASLVDVRTRALRQAGRPRRLME